jgi:hypothetical protein
MFMELDVITADSGEFQVSYSQWPSNAKQRHVTKIVSDRVAK